MKYKLTGVMKGRSGKFFGVVFTNGVGEVPDAMHKATGHVLQQDFAAVPMTDEVESPVDKAVSNAETASDGIVLNDDGTLPKREAPLVTEAPPPAGPVEQVEPAAEESARGRRPRE